MGRYNPDYDKRRLLKNIGWFCVLLMACKFTQGMAFDLLIPFLLVAIMQRKDTVLFGIILIGSLVMDISGYFIPKSVPMVVGQKGMMLMASVFLTLQAFGRRHSPLVTPVLSLFLYLIFIAIASQSGWCPVISNLKMLLFVMVFMALYSCAVIVMAGRADVRKLREFMLTVACFIIFGSLLVRPFGSISMMGAEELRANPDVVSLFRGVSIHSQTLGPWVAMVGSWLFADWAFSIQRKDKLYLALCLCCPIILYMTSSRTAMASYLAGMMFASYFVITSRSVKRTWRSRVTSWVMVLAVLGGISILAVPQMRDKAFGFIMKYDKSSKKITSDAVWGSRLHKLDAALENWRRSPVVGNGFQVSEDMKYLRVNGVRDVLSAPIEKSTWTYAILEEGGVIGMILFCLFIVVSLVAMIRRKAYIGATMLFTFLMTNFGEFGFFAMSATGGFFWCLTFAGLIFDHKRLHGVAVRVWQQEAMIPWDR